MRKLKILHCLVFYLPNRIGGIEVYVHSLNKCLQQKGHQVKVLVPDYPGEAPYAAEYDGIPVVTYKEYFNTTRDEFRAKIPGKGYAGFVEALKKESPDVVHFHQLTSSNGISVFHLQAARDLGIPVVYTAHLASLTCQTGELTYRGKKKCDGVIRKTRCAVCALKKHNLNEQLAWALVTAGRLAVSIRPSINEADSRLFQLLSFSKRIEEKKDKASAVFKLSDRVIVLTNWYYEVLKRNGFNMEKATIIRQGLPVTKAVNVHKHVYTGAAPVRVVFIGRMFPEKGLLILLKALEALDENAITLDIYGQIDDKPYFQQCEAIFSSKKNITYHGFINSNEIVSMLSGFDVLVLPSIVAEMAPLVVQEAFAAGIPVIGSNIGGIAEIIEHGKNGYLFEMGNVQQLKIILELLLSDKALLKTMATHITPPVSFDVVADEVEREYLSVVN